MMSEQELLIESLAMELLARTPNHDPGLAIRAAPELAMRAVREKVIDGMAVDEVTRFIVERIRKFIGEVSWAVACDLCEAHERDIAREA